VSEVREHQEGLQVGADHATYTVVCKEGLTQQELVLLSVIHDVELSSDGELLWVASK
jgi:hypothetical protein